jgi:hypothetical protein
MSGAEIATEMRAAKMMTAPKPMTSQVDQHMREGFPPLAGKSLRRS